MRILRAVAGFTLAAALVLGTAGCKQGVGQRCQVDSDCESGLECYTGLSQSVPPEGECQAKGYTGQHDAAIQDDAGPEAAPQDATPEDSSSVSGDAQDDATNGDAQDDAS